MPNKPSGFNFYGKRDWLIVETGDNVYRFRKAAIKAISQVSIDETKTSIKLYLGEPNFTYEFKFWFNTKAELIAGLKDFTTLIDKEAFET